MDLIPRQNWHEWKFSRVPIGFWDHAENRHRYFRWLGRQFGFRKSQDWYRIDCKSIIAHRGTAILKQFPSLYELMHDFLPGLDWGSVNKYRPITTEEILVWARRLPCRTREVAEP